MSSPPSLFSYNTLVHAVAGSLASVTAMTTTYPLDSIRARIQLDTLSPSDTTLKLLVRLLNEEGVAPLYRGLAPTLQSLCASNFVYFYVFHGIKNQVKGTALKHLVIGAFAGAVNVLVTTPLWVVNTRIRMGANYKSISDGLSKVAKAEGIKALWAGTYPSLLLAINPAIQFMTYEGLKRKFKGGALLYFLFGAMAKCISTIATYPLQLVQAKMRHGCGNKTAKVILMEILKQHGFIGLYKGMESKLLQTVVTAALMFAFYERIARFVFHLMGLKSS